MTGTIDEILYATYAVHLSKINCILSDLRDCETQYLAELSELRIQLRFRCRETPHHVKQAKLVAAKLRDVRTQLSYYKLQKKKYRRSLERIQS